MSYMPLAAARRRRQSAAFWPPHPCARSCNTGIRRLGVQRTSLTMPRPRLMAAWALAACSAYHYAPHRPRLAPRRATSDADEERQQKMKERAEQAAAAAKPRRTTCAKRSSRRSTATMMRM